MTVLTVFADAADGDVLCGNATYLTARSGAGTLIQDQATPDLRAGQNWNGSSYICYEGFVSFDTSALGASATITAVALSLWGTVDGTTTDFTAEARLFDWGATLTTADFIAGASLSGNTLAATFATTGFATGAYNTFTESGTAFQTGVNKTGSTRLVIDSDRDVAATVPTGAEFIQVASADTAGTTNDPKLVVTYTIPAISVDRHFPRGVTRGVTQGVT